MRATIALIAVMLAAGTATAAPRKVLVLRADGKIDAAAKARIDTAVLALSQRIDGEVSQGDITFADATAAVGCTGDAASCGPSVLDTLAVDELVTVSVERAPGGEVLVTVGRINKSGARDASGRVPAAKPEPALSDAVGSLFGSTPRPAPVEPTPVPAPAPAPVDTRPPPRPAPAPAPVIAPPTPAPAPRPVTAQVEPTPEPMVTGAPNGMVDQPPGGRRSNKLPIAGLATGGVLMIVGAILWNEAGSYQVAIDDAPTDTPEDFDYLQGLESSARGYALWGNITFFTGVAVAGASGFLLWRNKRGSSQARIMPVVSGDSAAVVLTIGGGP